MLPPAKAATTTRAATLEEMGIRAPGDRTSYNPSAEPNPLPTRLLFRTPELSLHGAICNASGTFDFPRPGEKVLRRGCGDHGGVGARFRPDRTPRHRHSGAGRHGPA